MIYQIMSRSEAKRASYGLKCPTIIISITDPDKDPVVFCKAPHSPLVAVCRISFDDIDQKKNPEDILMTKEDAERIKGFVERYKEKAQQIIVHCEAGQSRSAGIMAAIKEWLEGDRFSVWNDPKYTPNRHCYRTMMEAIFGNII